MELGCYVLYWAQYRQFKRYTMLIKVDENKLDRMLFSVTNEIEIIREAGMIDKHPIISILLDVLDVYNPNNDGDDSHER